MRSWWFRAAAEVGLLAPDGARVGAAVERGGPAIRRWIVAVEAWKWPHCLLMERDCEWACLL